ncbi:hypothetical protein FHG87_023948, partial [Trinorchestia longiramus]
METDVRCRAEFCYHYWKYSCIQACSFILATPDTLKYTTLYETLVGLLGVSCQVDPAFRASLSVPDIARSSSSEVIKQADATAGGRPVAEQKDSEVAVVPGQDRASKGSSGVATDGCAVTIATSGRSQSSDNTQLSYLGHCAVQYTFSFVYRVLLTLPPSVAALETLASPDAKLEGPWLLHALIWGPRASHKVFNGWIK